MDDENKLITTEQLEILRQLFDSQIESDEDLVELSKIFTEDE